MVAEQGERVQRIDADTQDIADNVRMGHNELLKYWGRISNDRWLMLKIFGVLIVFVRYYLSPSPWTCKLTMALVLALHPRFVNSIAEAHIYHWDTIFMDIIIRRAGTGQYISFLPLPHCSTGYSLTNRYGVDSSSEGLWFLLSA